eukprot:SM000002S05585  [mRNA]  locus=s2:1003094:1008237:+ [translate_table: standard]
MTRVASNSVLVVPPFEVAWLSGKDLQFPAPGRGCVCFEARAENDVTVVFRADTGGSRHYCTDTARGYTVVLGSHRNQRLKIEVDGQPLVDLPGMVISPTQFERYWINIINGEISVGRGEPGHGVVHRWEDPDPNRALQYGGLSSWDKHVGYRDIQVKGPISPSTSEPRQELCSTFSLEHLLYSADLADLQFVVGPSGRRIFAHRVVLVCTCAYFQEISADDKVSMEVVRLPSVDPEVILALLQYLYRGTLKVHKERLEELRELAEDFGVPTLVQQCEQQLSSSSPAGGQSRSGDIGASASGSDPIDLAHMTTTSNTDSLDQMARIPMDTRKLQELQRSGHYCDVSLSLESGMFVSRVHSVVLSAWSPAFARMLANGMQESRTKVIHLSDASPEAVVTMLHFLYSGSLPDMGGSNVEAILLSVLSLAHCFLVWPLQHACCNLLLKYVTQNAHLQVTAEEKVLDAAFIWACDADKISCWQDASVWLKERSVTALSEREGALEHIVQFVRFPSMPLSLLLLIAEALQYLALDQATILENERLSTFKELLYICDGDQNGVCYYAGTSYGRHSWMNPVLIKNLTIAASSPPSRYTDPKTLVSGHFQCTSFAGQCHEDNRTTSWWKVDLGAEHQLICNYYTVRQDGSTNYMRSWCLQGSVDGETWINLRMHEGDTTMCRPGQYSSWPVFGAQALLPYRILRIKLLAPTTSVSNPYHLSLCSLELYGFFH